MGVLLAGAGVGGQIAGGLYRAQAAKQQGKAIADAALYNAKLAEMEGTAEFGRRHKAAKQYAGTYRAQMGKSGLRMEGTPLEFLIQNAEELERDAFNAMVAARNTATLDRSRAKSAKVAGRRSAGTELLSGFTRAAAFGSTLIPRKS